MVSPAQFPVAMERLAKALTILVGSLCQSLLDCLEDSTLDVGGEILQVFRNLMVEKDFK